MEQNTEQVAREAVETDLRNRFGAHLARSKKQFPFREHTNRKSWATPENLVTAFQMYMAWADANPYYKNELVRTPFGAEIEPVPVGRAYTLSEFAYTLGFAERHFTDMRKSYRDKKEKGIASAEQLEVLEVFEWIETCIKANNCGGAIVGVYNASFVAKMRNMHLGDAEEGTGAGFSFNITVRDQQTADDLNRLTEGL